MIVYMLRTYINVI